MSELTFFTIFWWNNTLLVFKRSCLHFSCVTCWTWLGSIPKSPCSHVAPELQRSSLSCCQHCEERLFASIYWRQVQTSWSRAFLSDGSTCSHFWQPITSKSLDLKRSQVSIMMIPAAAAAIKPFCRLREFHFSEPLRRKTWKQSWCESFPLLC